MQPNDTPDDPDLTALLTTPGAAPAPGDGQGLAPGARLGRYRIESLLGRGGMGEVYRAEQLEPVRRTVALKLLRQQRLDARNLAYFEVERQMLAQMRHPAIAQVFDAGTTADGHPYFAMEFIDGTPVTRYCQDHALPLRARIELFIAICGGVQHAHHKGVIHRDLKPANLLVDEVDGRPLPKIIDFGIAMAVSRAGGGGERAGTPEYMSPEQAGPDPATVDTRSDVYSLGVVLYELLAGRRPASSHETGDVDAGGGLSKRSERLATLSAGQAWPLAQGRGATSLRRALRELDWVVRKAMAHDRAERYASASALADDLRGFLAQRPLQAAPATPAYVWGKFVRRHRVGLAAASVALCALLGGLALSLYGLQQAREQRAVAERRTLELEKVAGFQQSMLEDIDIEAMGLGMAGGLREQLDHAPGADLQALEQMLLQASTPDIARSLIDRNILSGAERAITRDFSDEPALAADLRHSVAKVRNALGLYQEAADGYRQVAEHHAAAGGAASTAALEARQEQAHALYNAQALPQAAQVADAALADAAPLPVDHRLRIGLELLRSQVTAAQGDRPQALLQQRALQQRASQAFGEGDTLSIKALEVLAITEQQSGDVATGRAYMETVLPLRKALSGERDPATLGAMGALAVMRAMTRDFEGAIALQQSLVEAQSVRLGNEHPLTLSARGNLVNMLIDSGRADEARAEAEAVVEARVRVLGAQHPQTLRSMLNLSTLYARLEEFEPALAMQEKVIEARMRLLGARHPDTLLIRINHAGTLRQADRPDESLREMDRLLPLAREVLEKDHPRLQEALLIVAEASADLGRTSAAIDAFHEVLAMQVAQQGEGSGQTIATAWKLGAALQRAGLKGEGAAIRARYVTPLLQSEASALTPELAKLAQKIREAEDAGAS